MANTKYLMPQRIIGIRVPKTLRNRTDSMLRADLAWKTGAAILLLATGYLAMREARKGSPTRKVIGYLAGPRSPAREFGAMMLSQALDAALDQWSESKVLSETKRPKRSRSQKRQLPAKIGKKAGKKTAVKQAHTVGAENATAIH